MQSLEKERAMKKSCHSWRLEKIELVCSIGLEKDVELEKARKRGYDESKQGTSMEDSFSYQT